jgi:signal transduction histidine kinase
MGRWHRSLLRRLVGSIELQTELYPLGSGGLRYNAEYVYLPAHRMIMFQPVALPIIDDDLHVLENVFRDVTVAIIPPSDDLPGALRHCGYFSLPTVHLAPPSKAGASFVAQTLQSWQSQPNGKRAPKRLKSFLAQHRELPRPCVLVFEHAECIHHTTEAQRWRFLEQISEVITANPDVRIVFAASGENIPSLAAYLEKHGLTAAALLPPYLEWMTLSSPTGYAQLVSERQQLQTENQRLREQLAQQQRDAEAVELLKSVIVSTVSHEFNTPLLQIKTSVHMLAEDRDDNREMLLRLAQNAAARLQVKVQHITQLAQSLDIHPDPMLVRDAVEQALSELRRSSASKEKIERIRVQTPDKLPPVIADRKGIGTVLYHLLDNALKFSEGVVEIRADERNQQVIVSVRDDGIGIAPELQARIFDLFFQADSSDTKKYPGMGIGLAIVRLILDRHQIAIHIESQPQHGSQFWFALPTAPVLSA